MSQNADRHVETEFEPHEAFPVRKILHPTDFSDSSCSALTRAVFLANRHNAELHLLHVVELHGDDPLNPEHHFPDIEEIYGELLKVARSEMKDLLAEGEGQTLRVREHLERAISAAPEIVLFADELGADLIVMGCHGRRGARRLFLGSVAEEVVRTAHCPVMTLQADGQDPLRVPKRVVAPVDFSEESAAALAVARVMADTFGARLDVVHVVEHPTFALQYEPFYNRVDYSFPRAAAKIGIALAEFLDDVDGPDVDTHYEVLEGSPAKAVVDYAEREDAGLIVIATHGLTGLEHFLLGSVTERVVRMAHCPVLTMKAART